MEAVIGLFLIVALVALLSGGSRGSVETEKPVRYIEVAPSASARSTSATRDGGSGLFPALVLLLTILALFASMR
jgi:hypothetical protein